MSDRSAYMKEYRRLNREKIKELQRKYYSENRESLLQGFRSYYLRNKETRRLLGKKHYEENKSLYLHYSKLRKALLKNRVPNWCDENELALISSVYKKCKQISEETGVLHHVDHVVPLQGQNVCGFHVYSNLRIITAEENLKKSNRHE